MTNGNPQTPREPGQDENGENKPQKPRSFAGIALVGLVVLIVWMVVQANFQDQDGLTVQLLVEQLALGKVEKLTIAKNEVQVEYRKEERFGKNTNRGTKFAQLTMPPEKSAQFATAFRELQDLGRRARDHDKQVVEAVLLRLDQARRPRGNEASPTEEFVLYRRYVVEIDDQDALLVDLSVPPYPGQSGANSGSTSKRQAFLLQPVSGLRDDQNSKIAVELDFSELLALTNTTRANERLGLPAPQDNAVTTDLTRQGALEYKPPGGIWEALLFSFAPWILIILFLWFFIFRQMRSSGMGNNVLSFGRSRARMANREKSTVTFADVAGIEEAKDEVGEIVEFLKHPGKFARLGGRIPRGVLLVGSPGTGKTLLAKAIAGEADVPFYSICGSDFVEMFVGVGASRVRDLFKQARENSPCIIFLDEIDAVGRRRGAGLGGGHDEREQTLNAILVEMDGFETDTGIIVIAATNRADVLDPALLRPGRFDREIAVDLPDVNGREAILKVHARKVRMHPSVDLARAARGTPGFSGAELEAVINESAILATLAKKDYVYDEDIDEARDRVRFGRAKTSRIMDPNEQRNTAYHEAGHAMVSLLSEGSDPIHKVTIIPRGQALGATMYLPEKDTYSVTVSKAKTFLRICFGGRIAEEMFFGDYTSGASNDIMQATSIARRMVREWGMSSAVGPINYAEAGETVFIGRDLGRQEQYSETTTDMIDAEVKRIINEAYTDARQLLEDNMDKLELLADNLLKYEVLNREEIDGLMNGMTVEEVREREAEERRQLEVRASDETPLSQPLSDQDADTDPEPKLPPGLAGEGA